jgi:CheY-like chemotaxis protein/ribonuclease BN (tRNA processing enzyme)
MHYRGSILITDDSEIAVGALQKSLQSTGYQILVARDGQECLDMVKAHAPELIFLDIMLPKVHGIKVLRTLKGDSRTEDIGIIMSTGKALPQDYQSAIDNGADYYLIKPFKEDHIQELVNQYFAGTLKPTPLSLDDDSSLNPAPDAFYKPQSRVTTQYIKFWGTRGSIPVAGLDYYRYGGNTSCLEIRDGEHLVIIDAGTGIRELGESVLESGITDVHLIIGHTHWDHIMGFPFFGPVYSPKFNIHIYAATGFHKSAEELFSGMLDHDYFPVRLDEMQANFRFHDLQDGAPIEVGQIKVHYQYANHPGSTLCFKIESKNRTIGYATDNEMLLGYHGHPNAITENHPLLNPYRGLIEFYKGCDVLVHEAQFTPEEYLSKVGWGHTSVSNAAVLLQYCQIHEWVACHHDPTHTDSRILKKLELHRNVLDDCNLQCRAHMAYDSLALPL